MYAPLNTIGHSRDWFVRLKQGCETVLRARLS